MAAYGGYGVGGHQLEDLAALQRSTLAASLPQLVGNQAGGAAATPAPGKGVSRKTILLGMLTPLLFLAFSCFRPSFSLLLNWSGFLCILFSLLVNFPSDHHSWKTCSPECWKTRVPSQISFLIVDPVSQIEISHPRSPRTKSLTYRITIREKHILIHSHKMKFLPAMVFYHCYGFRTWICTLYIGCITSPNSICKSSSFPSVGSFFSATVVL